MTRKRFVKLLMSSGMSRNRANAYARGAVEFYGSYDAANVLFIRRTLAVCVKGMEWFKETLWRRSDVVADVIRPDEELYKKCLTGFTDRWVENIQEGQQDDSNDPNG